MLSVQFGGAVLAGSSNRQHKAGDAASIGSERIQKRTGAQAGGQLDFCRLRTYNNEWFSAMIY